MVIGQIGTIISTYHYIKAKMNLFVMALEESAGKGDWTDRHNYFRIPLYKGDNETK